MSTLKVNSIEPYSGTTVAVTGTLDVSGTIKTYAFETITVNDTNYMGSNSFGNDGADKHNFSGSIFVTGSAAGTGALTGITIETANVSTILSASAHEGVFTIDCDGDIVLDADGADVTLSDGGTGYLKFTQSSGNCIISSSADTKDIIFHGDDATEIFRVDGDAKQLKASQTISSSAGAIIGGATILSNTLSVSGSVTLGDAAADVTTVTGQLTGSQGAYFADKVGVGTAAPTSAAGIAQFIEISDASSAGLVLTDTGGRAQNIWSGDNKLYFWNSADGNVLTLSTDKYVGINVTDPDAHLEVLGTGTQLKLSYDADSYATIVVASNSSTTIATGESGDITLDAAGDIILDAAGGDVLPASDNATNLGSASKRWANVYTGDLHLKNDRGDWTILEESDYLCVINNATGKKYKMMLQEIEDQ